MPTLDVKVIKEAVLLNNFSFDWTEKEYLSRSIRLSASDEEYVLDTLTFEDLRFLLIKGNNPFFVTITKNEEITQITVEDIFLYSPCELDRDLIESISISAINDTEGTYEIYLYGET